MQTVRKSALVARSAQAMFDLVEDIERYPQFLPWCSGTKVLERTPETTKARIDIDYRGLVTHFTTLNRKQEPHGMDVELDEGPFDSLHGRWSFTPLGEDGCRVEFVLDYAFSSAAMSVVLAPVFGHIAETLVERFVARADGRP
jgi:ribosome-associated toxin RatA of RatAB toxin-antitoxin module